VYALLGASDQAAAAAAQLKDAEWTGLCGAELCTSAHKGVASNADRVLDLTLETVQTDDVAPYVEVFIDRSRVAEGAVAGQRRFAVPVSEGVHEVEVRVANPRTRGGIQRRLRLS
jgi:hypothetical protein